MTKKIIEQLVLNHPLMLDNDQCDHFMQTKDKGSQLTEPTEIEKNTKKSTRLEKYARSIMEGEIQKLLARLSEIKMDVSLSGQPLQSEELRDIFQRLLAYFPNKDTLYHFLKKNYVDMVLNNMLLSEILISIPDNHPIAPQDAESQPPFSYHTKEIATKISAEHWSKDEHLYDEDELSDEDKGSKKPNSKVQASEKPNSEVQVSKKLNKTKQTQKNISKALESLLLPPRESSSAPRGQILVQYIVPVRYQVSERLELFTSIVSDFLNIIHNLTANSLFINPKKIVVLADKIINWSVNFNVSLVIFIATNYITETTDNIEEEINRNKNIRFYGKNSPETIYHDKICILKEMRKNLDSFQSFQIVQHLSILQNSPRPNSEIDVLKFNFFMKNFYKKTLEIDRALEYYSLKCGETNHFLSLSKPKSSQRIEKIRMRLRIYINIISMEAKCYSFVDLIKSNYRIDHSKADKVEQMLKNRYSELTSTIPKDLDLSYPTMSGSSF